MKFAVVLLALVSVAVAAPQPRKVFHENYQDFLDLIAEEASAEIGEIIDQYVEFEEFLATMAYLETADFKNLVYEMEALPEFVAVQNFLDSHSVDISYFIDLFNETLEMIGKRRSTKRQARQSISGRDFNSFTRDCTAVLPKDQLAALYDEKLSEDEDFKAAIEGIESQEFIDLFDALWNNEVFQAEVQILADNGIDIEVLFDQLVAVFGQDVPAKL